MPCITITINSLIVGICWFIGLVFAVIDVLFVPDWAALSTAFIVVAATLTVKARVDRYARDWTTAYEAGREAAEVRQIR